MMGDQGITIRDEVHNEGFEFEGVLRELIATPAFGRLQGIKQLALADVLFPGATHTRYAHSVGAAGIGGEALERLARFTSIPERDRTLIRIGLLLHDIGHYPYSHMAENLTAVDHETHGRKLIAGTQLLPIVGDGGIPEALARHGFSPDEVIALLDGNGERPRFYHDLISSKVLDLDRFDYLLRDSYHTGTRIGAIDAKRILEIIRVDPDGILGVDHKGVDNIEQFLWARAKMHKGIYHHEDSRIAEAMMLKAMRISTVRPEEFYDDAHLKTYLLTQAPEAAKRLMRRLERRRDGLYETALKVAPGLDTEDLLPAVERLRGIEAGTPGTLENRLLDELVLGDGDVIVTMPNGKPPKEPPYFPVLDENGRWADLFASSDDAKSAYRRGNITDPFSIYCPADLVAVVRNAAEHELLQLR